MQHRFDIRMKPALIALEQGLTTQPVHCLTCGSQITSLDSQCKGPGKSPMHPEVLHPSRDLTDRAKPLASVASSDRSNIHV